jgi:hypothetical protein
MAAICRSHLCFVVDAGIQIQHHDGTIVTVPPLTVACPVVWYHHAISLCFPADTAYLLTGPCGDVCIDEYPEHTHAYVEANAAFAILDHRHHGGVEPLRIRFEEAGRYSVIAASEGDDFTWIFLTGGTVGLILLLFLGVLLCRRMRLRERRQETHHTFETVGASPRLPPRESDTALRDFTL